MPEYKEIKTTKQLLVEGNDADFFFSALLDELSLSEIQIQNYGGIDELKGFLKQFCKVSGFWEKVVSLGIVRDAETDPSAAFQSVSGALGATDLPVPQCPLDLTDTQPRVSVFILPDAETNGMLETVCLRSVEKDPAMFCVEEYFKCLKERLGFFPKNMEKARLQAFLASREKVPRMLGVAAKQGYWPWNSPIFESISHFLKAL
jgi:hypothetical protein